MVQMQGSRCTIVIESDCRFVQSLAEDLVEVDPLREVFLQDDSPRIWQVAAKHQLHAACPVPVGILKAVEVEAGLALPAEVWIAIVRE